MSRKGQKFDSKEKAWIRENIWLRVVENIVAEINQSKRKVAAKYFTFCGPLALDVELFVEKNKLIKENAVVAWERNQDFRNAAKNKFQWLNIKPLQFENLWKTQKQSSDYDFDFDLINLDFTCRPFKNSSGEMSDELRGIREMFNKQRVSSKSFYLLLTFNANYDPHAHGGNLSLISVVYDHARRFGFHEGYFRLATKGIENNYYVYILEALPSIIIRFGYESAFSVSCIFKCFYVPYGRPNKHPHMASFVFKCEWTNPPLSLADPQRWGGETGWQHSEQLKTDQLSALKLPVMNINHTLRYRNSNQHIDFLAV